MSFSSLAKYWAKVLQSQALFDYSQVIKNNLKELVLGFHGNNIVSGTLSLPGHKNYGTKNLFPIYIQFSSQNQKIVSHRFPGLLDMEQKQCFSVCLGAEEYLHWAQ